MLAILMTRGAVRRAVRASSVLRRATACASTSGGSGYADHSKAHLAQAEEIVRVPLVMGTPEALKGYAYTFPATREAFDQAEVTIEQWPTLPGRRPLCPDSGKAGGVREGLFTFQWIGDELRAINEAVDGNYVTGRILEAEYAPQAARVGVVTREANYHPDGGQIVCPRDGSPFVALLALPNEAIAPQDFVAFYCDGSFGIHINTNVWHQPVYPISDTAAFYGKQGAVHACAAYDSVDEHGKWLYVPLDPAQAVPLPGHLKAAEAF
ncbi:hypothetical protein PTSG_07328 [Salpingoeca rosetta]|uniref:Ureidoglycolate hydrolase n=1 Tax=Salpingoeca rosetta (strain ATCC 50818 / BSB-021) TaxID=946362 RepID=F2UJ37_SALR5|nr:uncharacterized protein PTSG_07328 [Salpingoeca rosetta]EGD76985.1 hypothetical protein PTSG_07328 [Salpingoeca rosetta]|eukprot:XP_004990825.1 hypothetical protein PTSG_07328 [Salpingoeca rosetta]